MNTRQLQGTILIWAMLGDLLVVILLSACGGVQSLPAVPAAVQLSETAVSSATTTAVPTDTLTPLSPTEDATVSFQEFKAGYPSGWFMDPTVAAAATELVISYSQHLTAIALTPTETDVPYTPPPTPTYGVGVIRDVGCYPPHHDGLPQYPSCGDAYVNGAWYFVGAGYTGGGINPYNPPPQSLLLVCPEPVNAHLGSSSSIMYKPPVNVGDIHIESIAGSLVTVAPRDPANQARFVFDLATRQWVSGPTPGPSPSAAVSPTAAVSPLPTQTP